MQKENEIRTQGHHISAGSPPRSETTNLQGNSEQIVTVELSHFNEAIQSHQNRFDSWQNALRQADSSINQNSGITQGYGNLSYLPVHTTKNHLVTNASMSDLRSPHALSQRHLGARSVIANRKMGSIHERLYQDHIEHKKRRSSIYDPMRRQNDEQQSECTFQPQLIKPRLLSRCNSFCANTNRNQSQFLADMNNYLELKLRRIEDMKNKRNQEQNQKLRQEFDVISC